MPITDVITLTCDRCGNWCVSRGNEDAYGWLGLQPEHLHGRFVDIAMGHNELPTQTIVLCNRCRQEFKTFVERHPKISLR
jgi:hypothetical protein